MVKKFLITQPNYDTITSYLHDFSKEIVKTVKGTKDIHLINLEGPEVTSRADVVDLSDSIVYEILVSEKEDKFVNKIKKYPKNFRVVKVKVLESS